MSTDDLDLAELRRKMAPGFVLDYDEANEVIQAVPDLLDRIEALEAERDEALDDLAGYGQHGALAYERAERMTQLRLRMDALRERNDQCARADRAEAALARVEALHTGDRHGQDGGWCYECGLPWPCGTIRAIEGEES